MMKWLTFAWCLDERIITYRIKIPKEWRLKITGLLRIIILTGNSKTYTCKLNEILPKYIGDKIIIIPIPVNDFQNKVIWKFTSNGKLLVKIATSVKQW